MTDWRLSQVFGGDKSFEEINDADFVSSVEFDSTGKYLAAGDKGGRVVLFQKDEFRKEGENKVSFKFLTEFQSHLPEFDCLKSFEVDEKINQIKFLKPQNDSILMLTTNDKTIKLWKTCSKRTDKIFDSSNFHSIPKKLYANAHEFNINSISPNSDLTTFLSADDLRINIWDFSVNDTCYNVIDMKPDDVNTLSEVITRADFCNNNNSLFAYGTSKGFINLFDLRINSQNNKPLSTFFIKEDPLSRSFYSEIISSISGICFNGDFIFARDYFSIHIWDVKMLNKPVQTLNVMDHLKPNLYDLYENDSIFDKFDCSVSFNSSQITTVLLIWFNSNSQGAYHNYIHIFDFQKTENGDESGHVVLQASRQQTRPVKRTTKNGTTLLHTTRGKMKKEVSEEMNPGNLDYNKKPLYIAFHPKENIVAVSSLNNLYIFTDQ